MLGSSRNWQTAGRDLAERFHVCALDLRNHGASPHANEMTYDALVEDVLGWLDAQNLARATLVGHSLGGKVAMRLACRHPERVTRLVIVDIAPVKYFWPARREEFAAMNELNLGTLTSRGEAELLMEPRVTGLGMRKFIATNLERGADGAWRWIINLRVLTRELATMEDNSLETQDHYDGPALFIVGGRSTYVVAEGREAIGRHFSAARIETIEAAGHNPHVEARETFVRLVNAFT